MKHQAINLVKFKALGRRLQAPLYRVVGLLESLWIFAQIQARDGDLTKFSPLDIAAWLEWEGGEDAMFRALIDSGWLEETADGRVMIHDWDEHKPNWLKGVQSKVATEPATDIAGASLEEPGPEPSRRPGPPPGPEPSRRPGPPPGPEPAPLPPNLTLPNLTLPNPGLSKNDAGGKRAAGMRVPLKKLPRDGNRYRYPDEFLELTAAWRPFDAPAGHLTESYAAWASLDPGTQGDLLTAAANYCDECHRTKTKTTHLATFIHERWRGYIELSEEQAHAKGKSKSFIERRNEELERIRSKRLESERGLASDA